MRVILELDEWGWSAYSSEYGGPPDYVAHGLKTAKAALEDFLGLWEQEVEGWAFEANTRYRAAKMVEHDSLSEVVARHNEEIRSLT